MEIKRKQCRLWGVQVADCRYRPLDQLADNYDPRKIQTGKDYFIHPGWTDYQVKEFRKRCRWQNILVRVGIKKYDSKKMKYNPPQIILQEFGLI